MSKNTGTCVSPYNTMIAEAVAAAGNIEALMVLSVFAANGCEDILEDRLVLASGIAARFSPLLAIEKKEPRETIRRAVKTLVEGVDGADLSGLSSKVGMKNGAALVALPSLKPAKSIGDAMATALRDARDIETVGRLADLVTHVASEEQLPHAVFEAIWGATKRHGRLTKSVLQAAIAVARDDQRVIDAFNLTSAGFEEITGSPARLTPVVMEAAE